MHAFTESAAQTIKRLGTDIETGLSGSLVDESKRIYGVNEFTKAKPVSMVKRILDALKEPMTILLFIAAGITLIIDFMRLYSGGEADFIECVGILAAISLAVAITVAMEGRSAKAFEELNKISGDILVKTIRGGQTIKIHQKDIVVGDIVLVETGDKLPADGRLLECMSLTVDESALTGESVPVNKNVNAVFEDERVPVAERVNMLYSGCFITGGSGKMIVTEVGDSTEFGKIARELSRTEGTSTPLQEKLTALGKKIAMLGATAASLVFVVQVISFILNGTATFDNVSTAFVTSIILIVAAVPEGLPTIVALTLALSVIKMSKQKALVKKMIACETVGCINVICSDKTGTLTENRMRATDVYSDGKIVKPSELTNEAILQNFCLNSTANVNFGGSGLGFIGNPTECALLVAANSAGCDYKISRAKAKIAHVFPFSSEKKNMTTLVWQDGKIIAYSKGSPEKIIKLCKMAPEQKGLVENEIIKFEEKACRVIGLAHRMLEPGLEFVESEIESNMIFDGFVAITDPLRDDVAEAVARSQSAGIELKMLTGDNIITATAIANELNILDESHVAVEANYLESLSDEELSALLPKISVIARSTPGIKMRVVNTLKGQGSVVAVTGDGINDAPAIKNADVGIAMGIAGTEVSKEASDIVLLDDSFSTIVKSVLWGRGIYENFQRFIQFQLTVNLSAVVSVLASVLAGFAPPFTALQLLWINIIMDGPPALTLGLEPVRDNLMEKAPTKRDANIITKQMFIRILLNGLFISAVFLAQYAWNFLGSAQYQEASVLFTLFVVFKLFNAFNCRALDGSGVFNGILGNKAMLIVLACTFALQVVITQFGGAMFGTVPLSFDMWIKIVATASTVIIASEVFKQLQRVFMASFVYFSKKSP